MQDKEERKLKAVKVQLMRTPMFAFWSGILMVGSTEVVDNLPTAMTNGRDEFYGRKFIKDLHHKELAFVVLHEGGHKAYRHLIIWQVLYNIDPVLANIACDHVINLGLVAMDPTEKYIAFPTYKDGPNKGQKMGCYDLRFKGMNAKQIFDILRKEKKEKQEKGGQQGKPGQPGNDNGQGEGEGFDDHDWQGARELTKQEKHDLEREIDQAIRQGKIAEAKAIGQGAGNMSRELGDLLKPQIDWREVLREFVSATCKGRDTSSWQRPNRRFLHEGVYLPSMIGEKVESIVLGIDTSGSIGTADLNRFLSEVKAICDDVNPEKIDLLYWDSRVANHEVYDDMNRDTLVQSTRPKGGGGTDPTCMIKYMEEKQIKPQCIIMLTDGEIYNWGNEWNAPTLWVICNGYRNQSITAPVGKTVHIDPDLQY
jgi:predicted metal-dependent peptidase